MLTTIAAFLGVSVLVIVTPGQDTALTIRNTLLGGRRGGSSTALGWPPDRRCGRPRAALGWPACSWPHSRPSWP
jgi:hypothetical protein